jgi:hypothetical protein
MYTTFLMHLKKSREEKILKSNKELFTRTNHSIILFWLIWFKKFTYMIEKCIYMILLFPLSIRKKYSKTK